MVVCEDELYSCVPIVDEVFISWAVKEFMCECLV